ncbi:uncharacterized protein LOC127252734 isoform X2 [Andrographis paniculata]|nr:uncharacterized protein LOC127252734 isoform X2 [Andrographis paniculata]
MLMNVPIAILFVSGLRMLFKEVEFKWKDRNINQTTYLSYLEKKQLSVNDSRLNWPNPQKWKRKIDSPVVEAALEEFVNKILKDFVIDLWYSEITSDKEGLELIHDIIMDVLGEVSGRIKEVNLINLLTRDAVELIGDHLDLFRRIQSAIGKDVMGTLSSEERDERLKHHLLASKELHPALISPECEYKVIQQLAEGVLAIVLRPREAQCPLVPYFAREILTSFVLQPIMNLASPWYINELIEYIIFAYNNKWLECFLSSQLLKAERYNSDHTVSGEHGSNEQAGEASNKELDSGGLGNASSSTMQDEPIQPQPGEWAKVYEAATQRRTEVLMPENLENMWAIGIKYKKRLQKKAVPELQAPEVANPVNVALPTKYMMPETPKGQTGTPKWMPETSHGIEDKPCKQFLPQLQQDSHPIDVRNDSLARSQDFNLKAFRVGSSSIPEMENTASVVLHENGSKVNRLKSSSDALLHGEDLNVSKLRCQVMGADFEKLGSNTFAVYSIAVIDANNNTWIVKRRYRSFDRLHRHLKEIPNYTLHLPPKRIFTSSTEGALVHERCIQLDKYLQDLLAIPNVAEHIEVWDFLSATSENYSVGKSSSVVATMAVNVDGTIDDVVRQFKGVSDGQVRMAAFSPTSSRSTSRNSSWNADDINKLTTRQSTSDSLNSLSDNEEGDRDLNDGHQETEYSHLENSDTELKEDATRVLPEWAPPNLSVPVLNLVDKIFQLQRRGWIRRQVFWLSKQILQLVMEDAIDDWLLRQIQWLRQDDVVAQGIRWLQGILWPNGNFFLTWSTQNKLKGSDVYQNPTLRCRIASQPRSFEQQLEAARRASDIKKLIFDSAPTALVSLIGHKQYKRCARDLYYFLQSTVCLKQLGYGYLELGLVTVFPELRNIVMDIHERNA